MQALLRANELAEGLADACISLSHSFAAFLSPSAGLGPALRGRAEELSEALCAVCVDYGTVLQLQRTLYQLQEEVSSPPLCLLLIP